MKAIEMTGINYYIQTSDVILIQSFVNSLDKNPICVNIGSAYGTSALAMLERLDSRVVSIDIKDCPEEQKVTAEYKDRYQFIKEESQSFGLKWCRETVDLVFIDGGHNYQDCYEDIIVWYSALKPEGIMMIHDYGADITPEVKPAVDSIVKQLNLREIARYGKMIVFRKETE
jgi:predicted O-methyltransferase YrrM